MVYHFWQLLALVGLETLLLGKLYSVSPEVNILTLTSKQSRRCKIVIDPSSLKIRWKLSRQEFVINQAGLMVNKQRQHAINIQKLTKDKASWVLQPSQIAVTAVIYRKYLELNFTYLRNNEISVNKPIELKWFDLDEAKSETLLIPFSEGMRVPTNDWQWIRYLSEKYSGSNTCQDLKMPFWTIKQQQTFISYQLVTATNNQLNFSSAQEKLDMHATHYFTTLNNDQPFVIHISLGSSILSGAKMYRDWRLENLQIKTLGQRRNENPELNKLIGASHVYLFGHDELAIADVKDWWGLKNWYINQTELVVNENAIKVLKLQQEDKDLLSSEDKKILLNSIYQSLKVRFPTASPTLTNNQIQAQFDAAQQCKEFLIKNVGAFLISPERWGHGISKDMIYNLRNAGIRKLWLGFDNWMPAFFQPKIIEEAKQAGFLVGAYDSYNTAIAPGVNDAWLTAQLPEIMRNNCSIVKANGDKEEGFDGNGVYLNPACHQSYVRQRIKDILKFGGFNSLFLDVDGTAMTREDFRQWELCPEGMNENQMLDAFNDRLKWIGNNQNILLGTEDGNSLTTEGVTFAHGMETVGFGWTDPDMHYNNNSPYFLGKWYPENKPAFFFSKTKVKPLYKRLFFSPQFRVPLYQTVFHDVIINNHHWHMDSIKLSNVQNKRDLISMLYNTPAMIHLVRDEASTVTAPRLQALKHYQDGFHPIHDVIWNKSLTDFSWLDSSGSIQQTTFSDGSKIIANFRKRNYQNAKYNIQSNGILAILSNGKKIKWHSNLEKHKTQDKQTSA